VTTLLRKLTGGNFEDGAIARILARKYWSRGEAPTFRSYASAWLQARKEHTKPNPEWAFLSDRAEKRAGAEWKRVRARKAKKMIRLLGKMIVKPVAREVETSSKPSRSPQNQGTASECSFASRPFWPRLFHPVLAKAVCAPKTGQATKTGRKAGVSNREKEKSEPI
jgi:hypothetical protein